MLFRCCSTLLVLLVITLSLTGCGGGGGGGGGGGASSTPPPNGGGGSVINTKTIKLPTVTLSHSTVNVQMALGTIFDPIALTQASIINVATWEPVCAIGAGISDGGGGYLAVDTACVSDLNVLAVNAGMQANQTALPLPYHALLTRAQLGAGTAKITALTDAVYAQVGYLAAANYDANGILAAIDRAAQQLLAVDINHDGAISGADIALWLPSMGVASLARAIQMDHSLLPPNVADVAANPFTDYLIGALPQPSSAEGANGIATSGGIVYSADNLAGKVYVFDTTISPAVLATTLTLGNVSTLTVTGTRLYAVANDNVAIFDITDPLHPVLAGTMNLSGLIGGLQVVGTTLYAGVGTQLIISDVTNAAAPAILSHWPIPNASYNDYTGGIAVAGTLALVGSGNRLIVVDISNGAAPALIASVDGNSPGAIAISGTTAYVGEASGIRVIDFSDPTHPVVIRTLTTFGRVPTQDFALRIAALTVANQMLFVAGGIGGVWKLDISDAKNPRIVGRVGFGPVSAFDSAFAGGKLYVAAESAGALIVDANWRVDPAITAQAAVAGAYSFDSADSHTLWVASHDTKNALGVIQAISAIQSVDITDLANPHAGAGTEVDTVVNRLRVSGNFAYLASAGGLLAFDESAHTTAAQPGIGTMNDTLACAAAGCFIADQLAGTNRVLQLTGAGANGTFATANAYSVFTTTAITDLAADGNTAYPVSYDNMQAIDFTSTPKLLSYTVHAGIGVAKSGNTAVVTHGPLGRFTVVDATTPSAMTPASSFGTAGFTAIGAAMNGSVVYLMDRQHGVLVFDVVDPAHPQFIGQIRTNGASDLKVVGSNVVIADPLGVLVARAARTLPAVAP